MVVGSAAQGRVGGITQAHTARAIALPAPALTLCCGLGWGGRYGCSPAWLRALLSCRTAPHERLTASVHLRRTRSPVHLTLHGTRLPLATVAARCSPGLASHCAGCSRRERTLVAGGDTPPDALRLGAADGWAPPTLRGGNFGGRPLRELARHAPVHVSSRQARAAWGYTERRRGRAAHAADASAGAAQSCMRGCGAGALYGTRNDQTPAGVALHVRLTTLEIWPSPRESGPTDSR